MSVLNRPPTRAIEAQEIGECPFCVGQVAISYDARKRPDGVVHSLPVCAEFDDMGPIEFVAALTRARLRRAVKS